MSSVGIEFPKEQSRVRELLNIYHQLGPQGSFGAMMINQVLQRAEEAQASGDPVAILRAFQALKGCQ
jgi:hypothetical protein